MKKKFAAFGLPEAHRVRLSTTNDLKRLSKELKCRMRIYTFFSNPASCLSLISALLAEEVKEWITAKIYLTMKP